ncbi:M23 family metallopeptidase [Arthrobacter sp. BF1]|uniref:M23 family metallopeptidase n=1 Tax=Arthrobacter sp. BF1 TaxID=2821145 RepID=UPI001C4EDE29
MDNGEQPQQEQPQEATVALCWPLWDLAAPIGQHFGDNKDVYRRFGQEGHNGIDILVHDFTPVLASANGIVRYAGNGSGEPLMGNAAGECILIKHEDGSQTGYAHLSTVYVTEGYECKAGEVIGLSGHSGATTGSHLHWEYLPPSMDVRNGYMGRTNPLPLLGGAHG